MTVLLQNRTEAGQLLASKLTSYANYPNTIVLGLPRGGVPVAFEIARKLNLPLDVCLVRKLGVPQRKELAMGAIGTGGIMIINEGVVKWLKIPQEIIDQVATEEQKELNRRDSLYRGDRPCPDLQEQTIILVDDGIATGSTLRAAIATLKQQQPKEIIVAVPIAPPETSHELKSEVDQVICLNKPDPLHSISMWYEDFSQTTDDEVRELLAEANHLLTPVV